VVVTASVPDEIKPLGELELWNRPAAGQVAPWVRIAVALACVLGVVVVGAAAWTLWRIGHYGGDLHRVNKDMFVALPAFVMAMVVVVVALPDGTVSRSMRLAVTLPVIHAIALVVALFLIPRLDLTSLGDRTPMMSVLPVVPSFVFGLAVCVGLGRAIGGRREWAHAFVMLALAFVLLLGLWLPISSAMQAQTNRWGHHFEATWQELHDVPMPFAMLALLPPLLAAGLFTLISVRAPAVARRLRVPFALVLVALFGAAMVARVQANHGAFLIHDNFVHLLLAAVAIAIVATCTLALTTWLAGRRAMRELAADARVGAITDEDSEIVACLQITSWLRGPRVWMRSFVANTSNELLRVPSGATLATAVPRISSAMRTGEAVTVISKRDAITLGGFVEREVGDSPFRAVKMTVPGPSGITVGRRDPMSTPIESMLLTAWRPAVAYLLILLVVAAPSLIGLVVQGTP
jgi:hypothetical protein